MITPLEVLKYAPLKGKNNEIEGLYLIDSDDREKLTKIISAIQNYYIKALKTIDKYIVKNN